MQKSHKIARDKLITRKIKSKLGYDKKDNSVDIHVKDLILLKDNTARNKLDLLWLSSYEVIDVIGEKILLFKEVEGE
jgi:hypothetical protein